MKRREFLKGSLAAATTLMATRGSMGDPGHAACCGPTYASPAEAMKSPPETLAFAPAIYVGTGVNRPDYMATVYVDPSSKTYSQVIHRLAMPNIGDELHHYGWNACSSCHGHADHRRQYLVVPGLTSGRIHIVDALDPRKLKMHKVIEADEIRKKTNLSTPHTVHCLADGTIMLSMLGDGDGEAPGGFLLLNQDFEVTGRWKADLAMKFNYDFWYQPRHNVMISSEWLPPIRSARALSLKTCRPANTVSRCISGIGKSRRSFRPWTWAPRD